MKKILSVLAAAAMVIAMAAPVPAAQSLVSDSLIDPTADWAQYDELIAQIRSETDAEKRTGLMHQAEDILMATCCVIPLYYYNDPFLQKDYADGIYANVQQTKFFMYAVMTNGSDTLNLNIGPEPKSLDPAQSSTVDGSILAANSFSGLYTYNEEGHTVPACAAGYEVSEDGLTYTVTLKDGLKWSDGTDLTAADFEYSWKRAAAFETASDNAQVFFSGFEGYGEEGNVHVAALDSKRLQFVLKVPCAYMEELMASPLFFPVQKAWAEAHADAADPGAWCKEAGFPSNGAYHCTAWVHDASITYEKNPYWYDADKVTVNRLNFLLSADDTAMYEAYSNGSVDFADCVPADVLGTLMEEDNPELHIVPAAGTYCAVFNCRSKLFAGKTPKQAAAMREAFSLLIDRDFIIENIAQTGQTAAGSFIPIGMSDGNGGVFRKDRETGYYDPKAINLDYEGTIAKAMELLKFAGYQFDEDGMLSADTPISLGYLTSESGAHLAVAKAIRQDLAAIGIDMFIRVQDENVFLEERKNGNFDFTRETCIADFNDPVSMLQMWITVSGNNDCQFGR